MKKKKKKRRQKNNYWRGTNEATDGCRRIKKDKVIVLGGEICICILAQCIVWWTVPRFLWLNITKGMLPCLYDANRTPSTSSAPSSHNFLPPLFWTRHTSPSLFPCFSPSIFSFTLYFFSSNNLYPENTAIGNEATTPCVGFNSLFHSRF